MATHTNRSKDELTRLVKLTPAQLQEACDMWGWTPETGTGNMGLSNWMRRTFGSYSADQFGDVIAQVRERIGDTTDYSTYYK
jgi:hypothetical protein